jgi:hypothetical protein
MDLREIGWKGVKWMLLGQDKGKWRTYMSAVINIRVP